jgi:hypothetical protein
VDRRAKKAALFFEACDANPDTRVKIPNAMRIKGYSPSEAADRSLQQEVRREVDKIKGEAIPGPSAPAAAAAASALITLSTTANVGRPALRTITVPADVFVLPAARVAALLARGYEGAMPHAAFELLVITAKSLIMIKGVNKDHIEHNTLMIMFNELYGVKSSKGRVKENMFERVMRATNVSLNASVSPTVEDRRVRWTTYSNLHAWFVSFKAFIIEFGFATIGSNGRLVISEAMLRRIANTDKTEVSLDGSKTNAGGRPAVSFHDPHFCTGIFGSNAGVCVPINTLAAPNGRNDRGTREASVRLPPPRFQHTWQVWLRRGEGVAVHDRPEREGWHER